jgi:hypothetical protein
MLRHENFSVRRPLLVGAAMLSALGFACSGGQGFTAKGDDADGGASDQPGTSEGGGVIVVVSPDDGGPPANPVDAAVPVTVATDAQNGQDATFDGSSCSSSELACGGMCVPNDIANCGACGTKCAVPDGGSATCTAINQVYKCGIACGMNLVNCGSACFDVQTDPGNCGRCEHSCVAGACVAGQCQSWVVANTSAANALLGVVRGGTYGVVDLATDGTNVVWVDPSQGVLQVSATMGPSAKINILSPLQSSNTSVVANLAIANHVVAWTVDDVNNGVSLWSAVEDNAPSGAPVASLGSDSAGDLPSGLALDATGANAYFLDSENSSNPSPKSPGLYQCDLANKKCNLLYRATPPSVPSLANDVAMLGSRLFWTDSAAGSVDSNTAPGAVAVSNQNGPCLLALDATNVYWANVMLNGADGGGSPSFAIVSTPQANAGAVTSVVSRNGTLQGMGTDGTNLYFIENPPGGPGGQLEYVPVAGGSAPQALKAGQTAYGMAVGGGAIYWLNGDNTIDGIAAP